jgi:hypothetical protein
MCTTLVRARSPCCVPLLIYSCAYVHVFPFQVHVYVNGKPGSQSLPLHADAADVVVVQFAGTKEWQICAPHSLPSGLHAPLHAHPSRTPPPAAGTRATTPSTIFTGSIAQLAAVNMLDLWAKHDTAYYQWTATVASMINKETATASKSTSPTHPPPSALPLNTKTASETVRFGLDKQKALYAVVRQHLSRAYKQRYAASLINLLTECATDSSSHNRPFCRNEPAQPRPGPVQSGRTVYCAMQNLAIKELSFSLPCMVTCTCSFYLHEIGICT